MPDCHLCPARYGSDNELALHFGDHRNPYDGYGYASGIQKVERAARRTMAEDLLAISQELDD